MDPRLSLATAAAVGNDSRGREIVRGQKKPRPMRSPGAGNLEVDSDYAAFLTASTSVTFDAVWSSIPSSR
jgi:hypothetical protein